MNNVENARDDEWIMKKGRLIAIKAFDCYILLRFYYGFLI